MTDLGYTLYLVTCIPNGKQYVGITIRRAEARWKEHQYASGKPRNTFQRAISKYRVSSFKLQIMSEGLTYEDALRGEIQAIAYLGTIRPFGYNSTLGGDGTSGRSESPETRARKSVSAKNRAPVSDETRAKLSRSLRGLKRSAESCANIGKAKLGVRPSLEARERMSRAGRGRKHTEETIAKLSAARKTRPPISEETRQRMSLARRRFLEMNRNE